jgi:hypothetical protein
MIDATAEALALALGCAVYVGPEHLGEKQELPHIICVPTGDDFKALDSRSKASLAQVDQTADFICRARTYTDAQQLALVALEALAKLKARVDGSRIRYGNESWGGAETYVRSATLSVVFPVTLPLQVNLRVHVETITQHVRELELITVTQQEAPDGLSGQSDAEFTTTFEG